MKDKSSLFSATRTLSVRTLFCLVLALGSGCSSRPPVGPKPTGPLVIKGEITRVLGGGDTDITVSLRGARNWVRPDIQGKFVLEAPTESSGAVIVFETPSVLFETDIDDIPEGTATVQASFLVNLTTKMADVENVIFLSTRGVPIKE